MTFQPRDSQSIGIQRTSEIPWMLTFPPISSCFINLSRHVKAVFPAALWPVGNKSAWMNEDKHEFLYLYIT